MTILLILLITLVLIRVEGGWKSIKPERLAGIQELTAWLGFIAAVLSVLLAAHWPVWMSYR